MLYYNMVSDTTNKRDQEENAARIIVMETLQKNPRGLSITGIVNHSEVSRGRVRTALAYLLGAGKIEEERASMAKLYYLI